ncbi:hypothetical protein N657DRAFT_690979 [Parathielavia appendiculata]|uniref:Uncharacterized protein n=1 Tax=Parathielavia appendiculata TaxID=2587402 RepID=A0AAN6Z391_9PEZI|nr:hypothetical protein N657DRAFT_690979 [Parathielavia appendiculata]
MSSNTTDNNSNNQDSTDKSKSSDSSTSSTSIITSVGGGQARFPSGGGGSFNRFSCKRRITHNCNNDVYCNGHACAMCPANLTTNQIPPPLPPRFARRNYRYI